MKKILILPNPLKQEALDLTGDLIKLLEKYGFEPVLDEPTALQLYCSAVGQSEPRIWDGIEMAIALGGDGSMLNAARRIYPRQIPMFGINLGHLGFLTGVESDKIEEAISDLKEGNYHTEERTMLEAVVVRGTSKLPEIIGLNDIVVAKSSFARIIRLKTWIDNEYFTTYPADGLILATATGSTAYSLSAGGPILDPRLEAILITPICAHSMYARPVILSKDAEVKIIVEANHADIFLTADGQTGITLQSEDEIYVKKTTKSTKLIRFHNHGMFEVLKSKFNEGRI